ncbi:polyisoprenoid-binding protein YceI [Chitinophaga niastensis]|uniref:Polyisoprenoid-binding protein YceI n=1 Tax=Chitinophaga niastensis TaxID=536980 RepID=A0A2P8HP03_CHINA|nr:YceI family protein [Chitinophaga niastensis]PSL47935.1 polyisoprenoid-binding protein YceI [Chitinophaga niastensis]
MSIHSSISRILLLSVCILAAVKLSAQHYIPADEGSKVQFKIVNHLIFSTTVNGYFKGLKGDIKFDPKDLKSAAIEATVAVKTISTGIDKRDKDLQAEKYFNTDKYPAIHISSTSITATDKPDTYQLLGSLTIKGITKKIAFPFTATMSNGGCLFKATFTINRKDFQVGPDNAIDDKLTVVLAILGHKQ